MCTYTVADAKGRLSQLIRQAAAGEPVVITRHGKPVAELRALRATGSAEVLADAHVRFFSGRLEPAPGAPRSVDLLGMVNHDPWA